MIIDTRETLDNSNNREVGYVAREEFHGPDIPKRPILLVDYTAPSCTQNSQCADTNACTVNERCESGHCAVDQLGCDDGDLCTDDICDVQQGCIHLSGICSDGFSCTQDICDPGTGACSYVFNDTVCLHGGCQTGTCVADQNSTSLDPVTGCQVASVAPDGSPCSDGNGCTQTDTCATGECQSGSPVVCSGDQCRNAGTCNPGTGLCNGSPKPSGTSCNDGNACTQTDACDGAGACAGANPVVCSPLDQCHAAGTCNPTTGVCSNPNAPNGTTCNDGNLCTSGDACQAGSCDRARRSSARPLGQCHDAGICNPGSGVCSNPPKPGAARPATTVTHARRPTPATAPARAAAANPVVCTPLDQCHVAGTCDPGTGVCSNPPTRRTAPSARRRRLHAERQLSGRRVRGRQSRSSARRSTSATSPARATPGPASARTQRRRTVRPAATATPAPSPTSAPPAPAPAIRPPAATTRCNRAAVNSVTVVPTAARPVSSSAARRRERTA